jgi:hypothetical protein
MRSDSGMFDRILRDDVSRLHGPKTAMRCKEKLSRSSFHAVLIKDTNAPHKAVEVGSYDLDEAAHHHGAIYEGGVNAWHDARSSGNNKSAYSFGGRHPAVLDEAGRTYV